MSANRLRLALDKRLTGRLALPATFIFAIGVMWALSDVDASGGSAGASDSAARNFNMPVDHSGTPIARLIAVPLEVTTDPTVREADEIAPTMIRTIDPDALYRPSAQAETDQRMGSFHGDAADFVIPTGVERFDSCGPACETGDPLVSRTSLPVRVAPSRLARAATDRETEDFPHLQRVKETAGNLLETAVAGTARIYENVRDTVVDTVLIFR